MIRLLALLTFTIIAGGCASTYAPNARTTQLKQGMDKRAAIAVLEKNMRAGPASGGFCGGNTAPYELGTPVVITPDGFSFKSFKAGAMLSTQYDSSRGATVNIYRKEFYQADRSFSKATKIRVTRRPAGSYNCPVSDVGHWITVTTSANGPLSSALDVIHVSDESLDEVIAALSTLAPQARLIEGIGF